MNVFELLGKEMKGMMKIMKSSLGMMTQMKLKTEQNKVILGEYYKKEKRWHKKRK